MDLLIKFIKNKIYFIINSRKTNYYKNEMIKNLINES